MHSERTKRFGWAGFFTDVGALTTSQAVEATISFAATVFAASQLGPSQFGKAVLIMSLPRLLWSLSSVKSVSITTRYVAGAKAKGKDADIHSLCKLSYMVDGLVASVFLFTAALCVWLLPQATVISWLTVVYSLCYSFTGLVGTSRAVLSSWGRFKLIAALRICEATIRFALTILLLKGGAGLAGLVLATSTGHVVLGLGMFIAAHRVLAASGHAAWWKSSPRRALKGARGLISAFSWNYFAATLNGLSANLPLLLLGHWGNPESTGFYRLATSCVSVLSMLEASCRRVLYPKLSACWAVGGRRGLEVAVSKWCFKAGIGLALLYAVMIPAAPLFIRFAFGARFDPVLPAMQILLLGAIGSGLFFWVTPYFYACGEIALWTKIHALRVVCAIGLGWSLSLRFGAAGMAASFAACKLLFVLTLMAVRQKTLLATSSFEGDRQGSAVLPAKKISQSGEEGLA